MSRFKPLENITILDLSRLAPGPYGTCILGDLGAEVIKIEKPEEGDYVRDWFKSPDDDVGGFFRLVNRNKKSVALDLKNSADKNAFYELVKDSQVVVESFRPGTVEKLGIEYDELKKYNSNLIYASITGYGQSGQYKMESGHDINFIAVGGILGMTGNKNEKPVIPGAPIADLASGTFLALSIMSALLNEESQYIDVSMTDIITTWTFPYSFPHFSGDNLPKRGETRHQKYPSYNIYETKDGKYLALGASEEKFWENLCTVLSLQEFKNKHKSNDKQMRKEIFEKLKNEFKTKTRADWVDIFSNHDVPISPVHNLNELFEDPHIKDRNLVVNHGELGEHFRFPISFEDDTDEFRSPAPKLGEHTEEVLLETDLDKDELSFLEVNK